MAGKLVRAIEHKHGSYNLYVLTRVTPQFLSARHVTSRQDTTRSTCCWAHAFWPCPAFRTARLDALVSTRSTRRTCRVVSRRDV